MTRNDWIGLGTSVGTHLALVLLFAYFTAGRPQPPSLGALRLEMGAFAEGQPVQQATRPAEEASSEETAPSTEASSASAVPGSETEAEPSPAAEAESESSVSLPEQEESPAGEDPAPEAPPTEPEQNTPPAQSSPEEDASSSTSHNDAEGAAGTSGSGSAEGTEQQQTSEGAASATEGGEETGEASGAPTGEEGTGADENQAAPFDIEGLNRTRRYGPLPEYTEKVEATIKVRITVSPDGRVIGREPVLKANPSLERSVMEALSQWRFNRLPSGAPQKNQTGIVTFRFRLE